MTLLSGGRGPLHAPLAPSPSGGAGAGAARAGQLEGEAGGRSGQHLSACSAASRCLRFTLSLQGSLACPSQLFQRLPAQVKSLSPLASFIP